MHSLAIRCQCEEPRYALAKWVRHDGDTTWPNQIRYGEPHPIYKILHIENQTVYTIETYISYPFKV